MFSSRSAHSFRYAFLVGLSLALGTVRAFAAAPVVGNIATFAGTGKGDFGGDLGPATSAQLNGPAGVAVDAAGNVYIADTDNNRVRKVAAGTGIITTVAGTGTPGYNGDAFAATAAWLNGPIGLAVNASGDLFIADEKNHRIRKVSAATGVISTVAGLGDRGCCGDGGFATEANLNFPAAVAVDAAGTLFIADSNNFRLRRVDPVTNIITTLAGTGTPGYNGDGVATAARLSFAYGVTVDTAGNVYIADSGNDRIRKIVLSTGIISTVAGTGVAGFGGEAGPAVAARIFHPEGITVNGAGDVYFGDAFNLRIRMLNVTTGLLTTVAGSGVPGSEGDSGEATAGQLADPAAVTVDAAGNLYIADYANHRVRKVSAFHDTRRLSTLAGTGLPGYNGEGAATGARLYSPEGVAVDSMGNVYVADSTNSRVRKITPGGVISTLAGNGLSSSSGDGGPAGQASVGFPLGVAVDSAGNVYIADNLNQRIRKVTAANGIITTMAGNGTSGPPGDGGKATEAGLNRPTAVAVDGAGNIYIAEGVRIRKVTAATGVITTVAGNGTKGDGGDGARATSAQLSWPHGIAVDTAGNLYIADYDTHRVRMVAAATGIISTLAGTGAAGYTGEAGLAVNAQLSFPSGVTVDAQGSVFITDQNNRRVRKVAAGVITTVVGSGDCGVPTACSDPNYPTFGGDGGAATAGQLSFPNGIAVDAAGSLYVADRDNHRIRKAEAPPLAPAGFSCTRTSNNSVSLTWKALPGATSYNVKREGVLFIGGVAATAYADTSAPFGVTYNYRVSAQYGTTESPDSAECVIGSTHAAGDFDGDGRSDLTVYRASTGIWYVRQSSNGYSDTDYRAIQFGFPTDVPVPGDYDGDGRADIAVYRPSNGYWYVLSSSTNFTTYTGTPWGVSTDVPVQGDYDGDGKTDPAIYRPSTGDWWILFSGQNYTTSMTRRWGLSTDVPVNGDYDGDGKTDLAVFRPSTGQWWVRQSSSNYTTGFLLQWGLSSDQPVSGDIDGDGKTDVAVYRPSTGVWYFLTSRSNFAVRFEKRWGQSGDLAVGADYDGDGNMDLVVYRPSNGHWYILESSTDYDDAMYVEREWGLPGDTPVLHHPR
jgi:hypothetical protein